MIYAFFLSFFVQKSFFTNFFSSFCWDKLDYPGSIVYLSCFPWSFSLQGAIGFYLGSFLKSLECWMPCFDFKSILLTTHIILINKPNQTRVLAQIGYSTRETLCLYFYLRMTIYDVLKKCPFLSKLTQGDFNGRVKRNQ